MESKMLSTQEIKKMEHYIGYDPQKVYSRHGTSYFKPYRNYYDAAKIDIPVWDEIVKKGLAECNDVGSDTNKYYWLNTAGLLALSNVKDVYIYSENASGNEIDMSEDVITILLDDAVYCGYYNWIPSSAEDIAKRARLPKKAVVETLHYLRDKCGYVKNTSYGDIDSDGIPRSYRGWSLSKKWISENKDRYKKAQQEEYARIDKILRDAENGVGYEVY